MMCPHLVLGCELQPLIDISRAHATIHICNHVGHEQIDKVPRSDVCEGFIGTEERQRGDTREDGAKVKEGRFNKFLFVSVWVRILMMA